MADEPSDTAMPNRGAPGSGGMSGIPATGRKRSPPTIELPASEITVTAQAPRATEASAGEPAADAPRVDEPVDPSPRLAPDEAPRAPRPKIFWPALAGAIAGALAAGAIGFGSGTPPPREIATPVPDTRAVDAVAARVTKVETTIAALPAPPTPVAPPNLAPLNTRLDALDKALIPLREQVTDTRAQIERLAADLIALKSAPRETAAAPSPPPPDLAPLTSRLAQLEQTLRAVEAVAAKPSPPPADDPELRRALAFVSLAGLVRQGAPYAPALAAAKPLASDPAMLAPLEPFAASGVPGGPTLNAELVAILTRTAVKPAPPPAATGMLDRLQANAARLVKVERADAPADNPALQGIAAAAKRGDLTDARKQVEALSAAERAPFADWSARFDARLAALGAAERLANAASAALTPKQ